MFSVTKTVCQSPDEPLAASQIKRTVGKRERLAKRRADKVHHSVHQGRADM